MCGLAGEIRFDKHAASVSNVSRMVGKMKDRGPDSRGIFANNKIAFGHSRLKIIDLSDRSHQPMVDPELNLTLVFNGCIYNHKEIRKELENKGYRFFSDGDSEVILKAYAAWGEKCVEKFNGMFAIVIHDASSGEVFMARDRLGIKPLYYIKTPGALKFASTLPALLKTLRHKPELDPVALHHYMSFHSVVPAPKTIFKSIMKLNPATCMTFTPAGTYTEKKYWQTDFNRANDSFAADDVKGMQESVIESLRQAAQLRTVADVPVGVLLSGGIDSSLLVALLAENQTSNLKTFSIGFENANGEEGNEFKYSDIIAEKFGTDHHQIVISRDDLFSNLPACIHAMSEPMMSHDNIGFYLLGKTVSQHMKVVQSGQGADELFGGYFWYKKMQNSQNPLSDYAGSFFDRDHAEYSQIMNDWYVEDDFSREFVNEHFSQSGAEHPVDKALRIDSQIMLVDDPVKRVDNMTMAWGLEARVPFLDHNVVELASRIAPELKIKGDGKYILKEAARSILPKEIIDRPKGYFPVPELKYIQGEVLEYVKDILNSQVARERDIFKRPYIEKLLDDPESNITKLQGSKLWQIAVFESWMQSHGL